MQSRASISLNAIRIFAETARHQSIVRAAGVLGVTPSAVSHQIKNLELALATPLFSRATNAITLTPAGTRFLMDVTPGLRMLEQATDRLVRDANEITLSVSGTLAVRWLIPALERFKARHPKARIRVETSFITEAGLGPSVDMAITYQRHDETSGDTPSDTPTEADTDTAKGPALWGEKILTDWCCPVLSPGLLHRVGYGGLGDIAKVPAITSTADNWDWQQWARHFGIAMAEMTFADQFDMDDAALQAATAGLGMVLAPNIMTLSERRAGSLVALPGVEPVELGAYYLLVGPRTGGIVKAFRKWLLAELAAVA